MTVISLRPHISAPDFKTWRQCTYHYLIGASVSVRSSRKTGNQTVARSCMSPPSLRPLEDKGWNKAREGLSPPLACWRSGRTGPCAHLLRPGVWRLWPRPSRRCAHSRAGPGSPQTQRFRFGKLPRSCCWCWCGTINGMGGHVGNRVVTGNARAGRQAAVEHRVQPCGLVDTTVDRVLDLLRSALGEVVVLPRHRSEAAHLPETAIAAFTRGREGWS
jgi:hypothetical protein